ncbi:placenta-specific gene 8 protein-like [Pomacea canaliculata]|uniref:placenta-specific gene 8 protein-like n=1 Tax=Pomacea canaliculata TaxID=400727 RepID=UPI000D72CE82|nr:placenta-specific gene 8 protein-like [Pomacea canaliculata]XP_025092964.1 placenta-specific gene 8 protein-like [Pomacea canaliculata]XP_025092965.1 placenta-specific gene 8 protein-like [Pomacea canaliculata]
MDSNKVTAMPVASYAYSSNDSQSAFGPPSYDSYNSYNTFASPYGHVPVVTPPAPVHHTMVVVNQVAPQTLVPGRRTWGSGLYGCCEDVGVCLCATFLTYCAAAKLAQDLGENCCVPFCVPGWLVVLRTKFRTQMNIEGSVCNDCLVTSCCGMCAMCQLMREVNMARQSGQLP